MKSKAKHEEWLEASRKPAELIVSSGASYHDAMGQLAMRFMTILLDKCREEGALRPVARAAERAQVSRENYSHRCELRPTRMERDQLVAARAWAVYLVEHGATYREALYVFKRSILEAAVRLAKNNRMEASRMLNIRRRGVWNIPTDPAEVKFVQFRKPRRRAAA